MVINCLQVANEQCSVEKYALENEGTIQYDAALPKLEQFTLCAWMRFTNHKGDHSIFTYSGELLFVKFKPIRGVLRRINELEMFQLLMATMRCHGLRSNPTGGVVLNFHLE